MAGPILSTRSYIMINATRHDYRNGTLSVKYQRHDTNDSADGESDHSLLGRRWFDVNMEVLAKEEVSPHAAPLLLGSYGRLPVNFQLFESELAVAPYECELSVDSFEVTANPGDGSPVTRRLVGKSKGTTIIPQDGV